LLAIGTFADDPGMPLYLVRWPGLVAALVSATDEDDLIDILDETANPEGCTWSVYRGPVNIEFSINAENQIEEAEKPRERPLEPEQIRLGDVSRVCERDVMTAYIPLDSDTAYNMVEAITKKAFPALHAVVSQRGEELPEYAVRSALSKELDVLVQASWQHQQTKRRPDRDSRLAAMMGTSPRHVAQIAKRAEEATKREPPPPKKPTKPASPRKPKKLK
jgi:hypothetical protein